MRKRGKEEDRRGRWGGKVEKRRLLRARSY